MMNPNDNNTGNMQNQGQGWGPQAYQQYSQSYNQGGNFDNYSHQNVYDHYQQAVQQTPPDQMYQAHQQYYNQMPPQQRQGLFGGLMNAFQQHGISPQQAGIQGNEPSPDNLARASQYANQNPDILSKVFGPGGAMNSPLAKGALIGGLIFAGKQMFG